jgi:6-phosphogluconolactonase
MTMVFVGSYASPDQPGIHVFDLEADASLRLLAVHSGIVNPSFLALDVHGSYLFAVGESAYEADGVEGQVHSLRVDRHSDGMRLVELDRRSTGGDHPCHIAIDRSGRWLAVSNYSSGSVAIVPVKPEGGLDDAATLIQHSGAGLRPDRQSGPHTHSAIFAPDNRFLIVADLGIDRLVVYRFDQTTGSCDPVGGVSSNPGAGPRHMAFHPDGAHLFVVNELDNTLAAYEFNKHTAALRLVDAVPTEQGLSPESLAADLHVSSSGESVYVSNRGHDSIARFAFGASRGLRHLATIGLGGRWPRGFALAPDGSCAVVALERSDEIIVLPLAGDGGVAVSPSGQAAISRPSCVVLR